MKQQFGGFFDRLNNAPPSRRRLDHVERITRRANSIKQHIKQLLNARKGSSLCVPDFGLDDFNDAAIGTKDMVSIISADIKDTINNFEPRVKIVSIHHEANTDQPLELKFIIDGLTIVDNKYEKITFAMAVDQYRSQWQISS